MAWERAERDDAHDLAGPRLPETVTAAARAAGCMQTHAATDNSTRRSSATTKRSRSSRPCCWRGCSASSPAAGCAGVMPSCLSELRVNRITATLALLQAAADVVAAVRGGASATAARAARRGALRPGAQALAFHALRNLGRAESLRASAGTTRARRRPPTHCCAPRSRCAGAKTRRPTKSSPWLTKPWKPPSAARQGPGEFHQRLPAPVPARARRARRRKPIATPHSGWNHPRWWIERLKKDHPQQWQAILEANNTPGSHDLARERQEVVTAAVPVPAARSRRWTRR